MITALTLVAVLIGFALVAKTRSKPLPMPASTDNQIRWEHKPSGIWKVTTTETGTEIWTCVAPKNDLDILRQRFSKGRPNLPA